MTIEVLAYGTGLALAMVLLLMAVAFVASRLIDTVVDREAPAR